MTRNQAIVALKAKIDAARALTVVAAPALQPRELFLQIGQRRYQVASFEQASDMFCTARDASGLGASEIEERALIVSNTGVILAHVSYNGRVWAGPEYVADATPLYDNR